MMKNGHFSDSRQLYGQPNDDHQVMMIIVFERADP
jgi:hypothetical protein